MAIKNPKSLLCQLLYQKALGILAVIHNPGDDLWRRIAGWQPGSEQPLRMHRVRFDCSARLWVRLWVHAQVHLLADLWGTT